MAIMLVICASGLWLAWCGVCAAASRMPRNEGVDGLLWLFGRGYGAVWHRLRVEGQEHVAAAFGAGSSRGVLVVSNHTSGVDPILAQIAMPRFVRWMMMREMMAPALEPFWTWARVIAVDQDGRDTKALREVLRELKEGGVVGVFPEGEIERPARVLRAFEPGVGLLALKSGATIVQVVIDGAPTPQGPNAAMQSLLMPSRARVRVLKPTTAAALGTTPGEVAIALRNRAAAALGWDESVDRGAV